MTKAETATLAKSVDRRTGHPHRRAWAEGGVPVGVDGFPGREGRQLSHRQGRDGRAGRRGPARARAYRRSRSCGCCPIPPLRIRAERFFFEGATF